MKVIKKQKPLTLTVGIPTCYGGESLVATAESIRASKDLDDFRFMVVADRTPLSSSIRKRLQKLKVEIFWNAVQGSQHKKLVQMVKKLDTDIFVYTQDDITFTPDTISAIVRAFEDDPKLTMAGVRILPLPSKTLFESAMTSMVRMADRAGLLWNQGDNYLLANGRCLAFRVKQLKKFRIHDQVVNGDSYLYFENKRLGGKFAALKNSSVYIRCPQKYSDQIGPSSRFQFASTELQKYFAFNIAKERAIPLTFSICAIVEELCVHPLSTLIYFAILPLTRIFRHPDWVVSDPVWRVDESTKATI